MPRRLLSSGLLAGLLGWTGTAAGFALFEEVMVHGHEIPLNLSLADSVEIFDSGAPLTLPWWSVTLPAEHHDVLAVAGVQSSDMHDGGSLMLPLSSALLPSPEQALGIYPAPTAGMRGRDPGHHVLPIPPTMALLGLGGMVVFGIIRQGVSS